MAVPNILVSLSGTSYPIPQVGSSPWGQNVTNWIVAASGSTGFVQLGGGTQTLTADLNLGASFGLISIYFKSRSANIAGSGVLRLANADIIAYRNHGNTADDSLGVNANDDLQWSNNATGTPVVTVLSGNPFLEATTTAQSIPNATVTTLIYTTTRTDTDSGYNSGTGIFTVPANKGGVYMVSACWTTAAEIVGPVEYTCGIEVNGAVTQWARVTVQGAAAANMTSACSTLVNVAAGATISAIAYQTTGVAKTCDGTATGNRLTIKRIS